MQIFHVVAFFKCEMISQIVKLLMCLKATISEKRWYFASIIPSISEWNYAQNRMKKIAQSVFVAERKPWTTAFLLMSSDEVVDGFLATVDTLFAFAIFGFSYSLWLYLFNNPSTL